MMENKTVIQLCSIEHLDDYSRIYAAAFSGEPWNDPWRPEDARIHVRELLETGKTGLLRGFVSRKTGKSFETVTSPWGVK